MSKKLKLRNESTISLNLVPAELIEIILLYGGLSDCILKLHFINNRIRGIIKNTGKLLLYNGIGSTSGEKRWYTYMYIGNNENDIVNSFTGYIDLALYWEQTRDVHQIVKLISDNDCWKHASANLHPDMVRELICHPHIKSNERAVCKRLVEFLPECSVTGGWTILFGFGINDFNYGDVSALNDSMLELMKSLEIYKDVHITSAATPLYTRNYLNLCVDMFLCNLISGNIAYCEKWYNLMYDVFQPHGPLTSHVSRHMEYAYERLHSLICVETTPRVSYFGDIAIMMCMTKKTLTLEQSCRAPSKKDVWICHMNRIIRNEDGLPYNYNRMLACILVMEAELKNEPHHVALAMFASMFNSCLILKIPLLNLVYRTFSIKNDIMRNMLEIPDRDINMHLQYNPLDAIPHILGRRVVARDNQKTYEYSRVSLCTDIEEIMLSVYSSTEWEFICNTICVKDEIPDSMFSDVYMHIKHEWTDASSVLEKHITTYPDYWSNINSVIKRLHEVILMKPCDFQGVILRMIKCIPRNTLRSMVNKKLLLCGGSSSFKCDIFKEVQNAETLKAIVEYMYPLGADNRSWILLQQYMNSNNFVYYRESIRRGNLECCQFFYQFMNDGAGILTCKCTSLKHVLSMSTDDKCKIDVFRWMMGLQKRDGTRVVQWKHIYTALRSRKDVDKFLLGKMNFQFASVHETDKNWINNNIVAYVILFLLGIHGLQCLKDCTNIDMATFANIVKDQSALGYNVTKITTYSWHVLMKDIDIDACLWFPMLCP